MLMLHTHTDCSFSPGVGLHKCVGTHTNKHTQTHGQVLVTFNLFIVWSTKHFVHLVLSVVVVVVDVVQYQKSDSDSLVKSCTVSSNCNGVISISQGKSTCTEEREREKEREKEKEKEKEREKKQEKARKMKRFVFEAN